MGANSREKVALGKKSEQLDLVPRSMDEWWKRKRRKEKAETRVDAFPRSQFGDDQGLGSGVTSRERES